MELHQRTTQYKRTATATTTNEHEAEHGFFCAIVLLDDHLRKWNTIPSFRYKRTWNLLAKTTLNGKFIQVPWHGRRQTRETALLTSQDWRLIDVLYK